MPDKAANPPMMPASKAVTSINSKEDPFKGNNTAIRQQQQTISTTDTCFCLGEGTNYKIFQKLNDKYGFFKNIIPLPHPRWIMQYRRKKIDEYVQLYVEKLKG